MEVLGRVLTLIGCFMIGLGIGGLIQIIINYFFNIKNK